MSISYSSRVRSYDSPIYHGSPSKVISPNENIHIRYARALDQIESLQLETRTLRADLNRALDNNANLRSRDESMSLDLADQSMKISEVKKSLIEAEDRMIDLDEENTKLRHLLQTKSMRLHHLQDEIMEYQNKIGRYGDIESYNKRLQAEMQHLDAEFQTITRRVDELDEEKTQSEVNKTISVKYRQDYNQSLLKYIDQITKTIESIDADNAVRERFEELFPRGAGMQKLVLNRDYPNLTLKSAKFLADILAAFVPEESSSTFVPFSANDVSNAKMHSNTSSISQNNSKNLVSEPLSSALTQSPRYGQPLSSAKKSNVSLTRSNEFQSPVPTSGRLPSASSASRAQKEPEIKAEKRTSTTSKKDQKSLHVASRGSAATFGGSSKSRSDRSSLVNSARNAISINETPTLSKKSQPGTATTKQEISPIEKFSSALASRKNSELRSSGVQQKSLYQDKNAAELELLQRDQELLQKERELMEKKKELMVKARELEEKEQVLKEQRIPRSDDRKLSNLSAVSNRSGEVLKFSGFHDNDRQRTFGDNFDDPRSASSAKSLLKSQARETEVSNRRGPGEDGLDRSRRGATEDGLDYSRRGAGEDGLDRSRRGTAEEGLNYSRKGVGEDGLNHSRRGPGEDGLNHSSSTQKLRTAKEASEALREKSKHLAKVLTRVTSYERGAKKSMGGQEDDDVANPRDPSSCKQREASPIGSYKNLHDDKNEIFPLHSANRSGKGGNTEYYSQRYDDDNNSAYGSEHSYKQDRKGTISEKGSRFLKNPSDYNSDQQTPESTDRNDTSANKVDHPHKRVSFDRVNEHGDQYKDSIREHHRPFNPHGDRRSQDDEYEDQRREEDENYGNDDQGHGNGAYQLNSPFYNSMGRGDRYDSPRGNNFSTFSVSFGRTESHQRSLSPHVKNVSSILDVPSKGRVDHVIQSYDVIQGEDKKTKAVKDKGQIKYKIVPESARGNELLIRNINSVTNEKSPEESPQKRN